MKGNVEATVLQKCSVSGENITTVICAGFACVLVQPGDTEVAAALAACGDDVDVEELLADGRADLGEMASQYLCLEIDPHAASEGARDGWASSYTLNPSDLRGEDYDEAVGGGARGYVRDEDGDGDEDEGDDEKGEGD